MPYAEEMAVLVQAALLLARTIPAPLLQPFAEILGQQAQAEWQPLRNQLAKQFAPPPYRALMTQFFETWQTQAGAIPPPVVAAVLLTAAASATAQQQDQTIELVWTGPASDVLPFRQTEQALLQLIHSAQSSLIVVSYAVYKIPRICAALLEAARRKVNINLIIETPDRLAGENTYNTLKALGADIAALCSVHYWPLELRPQDAQGKTGILHPKCAVADGRRLFLSSANLTEYAFTVNQELGVLITGGAVPGQVEQHFRQMIQAGIFQPAV